MSGPETLTLLTRGDELTAASGLTGLLFECAPDSGFLARYPNRLSLRELVGDFDATKAKAFALAHKLLESEPAFRGVRQLGVFEEIVIRELQHAFHLIHLCNAVLERGVRTVRFESWSRWADGLGAVAKACGGAFRVESTPKRPDQSSVGRSLKRLAAAGFSQRALKEEWSQVMARVDPFHRRARVGRSAKRQEYAAHKIWFYSTAYTFTAIGLEYEPFFPEPFVFLVENPLTGGRPLDEVGRSFVNPHVFGSRAMEPSAEEVSVAASAIVRHIAEVPLAGDEALARALFLESGWLAGFFGRLLPQGLYQTELFVRWFDSTKPAALVVGNPVFEAYALHASRRRGVPTILIQHGILGDFCQFVDPPADRYIVRGRFWMKFLSPAAQARAVILNTPGSVGHGEASSARYREDAGYVLFITAPYALQESWHPADLEEILRALLRASAKAGAGLIVRVHPLEEIGPYQALITRICAANGLNAEVRFSQGGSLNEVVSGAAVAVTFASTMFLDCLRLGVPVVGLDWHDFSYKRKIEVFGVFEFAKNLDHLEQLTSRGIAGALKADSAMIGDFLAPTDEGALKRNLRELTRYAQDGSRRN